jgi:transcriptional regulator with XRE-family HTH domain
MAFSSILKGLRQEKKLKQIEVANSLNVTRQSIALYESGKREPNFNTLMKIADFYEVSIDYLFERVRSRKPGAYVVGNNIRLLRGKIDYMNLSKIIGDKLGVTIGPEKLELYETAKELPTEGEFLLLSKYFKVDIDFFFTKNDSRSYNLFKKSKNII